MRMLFIHSYAIMCASVSEHSARRNSIIPLESLENEVAYYVEEATLTYVVGKATNLPSKVLT